MKLWLSRNLRRFGNLLSRWAKGLAQSPLDAAFGQWLQNCGDETMRLDYRLDENAIVFDVGGYKGQWASDIFSKYCPTIHIFEPVEQYADQIMKRFYQNEKIIVHQFGLASKTEPAHIKLDGDRSSIFIGEGNSEVVRLVGAVDFINQNAIHKIDLVKINIEGGEYDLLDHLIETGVVKRIQNIQVQFHDFVDDAEIKMKAIQAELSKTHHLTYQYKYVWENWERNEPGR